MAVVLVTGAAKGIGRACAHRFVRAGHRVFAGVRQPADGAGLVAELGAQVRPVLLEVTDPSAIAAAASLLDSELAPAGLDGLVNNAGIVVAGPLEFLPLDAFRRQLEVNVVGALGVTQAMLPLLRRARGRIVNISSISGRSALPMVGAYAASKFALEALSDSLRVELMDAGVAVSLVEPGVIATPLWDSSIDAADQLAAALPSHGRDYYGWMIAAVKRRVGSGKHGLHPDRVARVVERALFERKPKTRYVVGHEARFRLLFQQITPDRVRDRVIASTLRRM